MRPSRVLLASVTDRPFMACNIKPVRLLGDPLVHRARVHRWNPWGYLLCAPAVWQDDKEFIYTDEAVTCLECLVSKDDK